MLKSGQLWTGNFVTKDATGLLSAATVGPVGSLYVAGVVTADVVTISGTNPYKFSVTLPVLTAGQSVGLYATATVNLIATAGFVKEDIADTKRTSDLVDPSVAAIQSGLATPTNITTASGVALTSAYDAAKTAAPTAAQNATELLDHALAAHDTAGTVGAKLNDVTTLAGGTVAHAYSVTVGGLPLADVLVEVSTDALKQNIIRSGRTGSDGIVTFYLNVGSYYFWASKDGYDATNPDLEAVA